MAQFVEKRLSIDMTFTFDAPMVSLLERLIEANYDRTFVLVVSPLHESVARAGGDLTPVRNYMATLEQRFRNVVCLVYDGRNYTDDYFLDTMHLNHKGAKRFSAQLRDDLRARGVIE